VKRYYDASSNPPEYQDQSAPLFTLFLLTTVLRVAFTFLHPYNSMASVRERTIPTDRPLVGDVSAFLHAYEEKFELLRTFIAWAYCSTFRGTGIAQSVHQLTVRSTGFRVRDLEQSRIFSSLGRPERFWGPPSLLSKG
jgi:hypothetical protein